MPTDVYQSPLCQRYASREMQEIFSQDSKFAAWRALWIALAEGEQALGLPITDAQIAQMKAHARDIDYDRAALYESECRHDVMAHIRVYADACPQAAGIIHLGATSCYVGDNADIMLMKKALLLIRGRLMDVVAALADFAQKHKGMATLAYTHMQPAQPTTVGKRACLWLNDLIMDIGQLDYQLARMQLLGCKGATGTAASFLQLFDGDADKCLALERGIAEKMGFAQCQAVSGQTYTRKADFAVLQILSGIAQSAAKFSNDIRLLCHLREMDEPFEEGQVGSSAMAYKRNPMRCERIAALSRYVICDLQNAAFTASAQWLERTLDDSANRRVAIPEAFLATDGILRLYQNVAGGMRLYPAMIRKHLQEELPFMATEGILMHCVRHKGSDRQALHAALRRHALEAAERMKTRGADNDLLERIRADAAFSLSDAELRALTDPARFTGMAERQCADYLRDTVRPLLQGARGDAPATESIRV